VLVPLALTAWVYFPITRVFFFSDDFVHLTEIANEPPLVFLLRPFGGNAFFARNLVFLASYHLFGPDPVRFQWTVLLAHLVNVWLLFGVLRSLTASGWLACLGATLWGTSPLAVGSLGWYAAFGHVLVGTTLLLVLRGVTRKAAAGGPLTARTVALWYGLLLIGGFCYGPGLGVALVFPAALFLLLPTAWRQPGVRLAFLSLPLATLALYFGVGHLYTLVGQPVASEELFREVALSGFRTIPVLGGHLLAYSAAGTLLGFFLPSAYPHPADWLAVVALVAGLGLLLWHAGWETRRTALALGAVWAGVYLMIAAGRAHLYALFGVPAASAATMGRYHYAGTVPLVCVLCMVLQQMGQLRWLRRIPRGLAVAAALCLWMLGYLRGSFHIDERHPVRAYFLHTQQEIAEAVLAAPPGTTVYLENQSSPPYVLGLLIPNRLFPGRAAAFLVAHPSGRLDGREVRFIERDPEILALYRDRPGTPLARLLVAPADAPPQ
jgi:hypothetical protein